MEIDESENNSITLNNNDLRNNMLHHISLKDEVYFKSQQINDPDLTTEEKRQIAESLLEKNPGCFLSRFGKYLQENHLEYFSEMAFNDYEVNYHLNELKRKFSRHKKKSTIRNRRLEALRRLTNEGEYFTDDQMRKRNPAMFEHLVGQYLTDDEKLQAKGSISENESFLGILLNAIDEREFEERLKVELKGEEEEPDESDLDEADEMGMGKREQLWGEYTTANISDRDVKHKKNPVAISQNEKEMLLNEFRSHVYSEFLNGRDGDFDYSKVDSNVDYDDLDMIEIDQQDKYFDSETPEILCKGDNSSDDSLMYAPPRSLTQKMEDLGK